MTADLFNAHHVLRARRLARASRVPIPFIPISNFGLPLWSTARQFPRPVPAFEPSTETDHARPE
jgi:hypothetical protein